MLDRTTAASAVTLAPDGSLVAAGTEQGHIEVWALPSGNRIAELRNEGVQVGCLTLARDVHRGGGEPGPPRWLLAAGSPSSVLVWELPSRRMRARCLGSVFEVHALAISPDGMTLASAGRFAFLLWDLATGQRLLEVPAGDLVTGLAFSPDGRRLACACRPTVNPGEAGVWSIETGRHQRQLRGLSTPVSKVAFSPDGRLLAALGHGWEVGVWEVNTGRLLHILNVPRGTSADNAGLAFGPDGQFAFASGEHATLWRLGPAEARTMRTWSLRPGLFDGLAFVGQGRLLHFRAERRDGVPGVPPERPVVLRVRDLLGAEPKRALLEADDLPWRVYHGALSGDGRFIVAGGQDGPPETRGLVVAYEFATGKRLWEWRGDSKFQGGCVGPDPAGKLVAVSVTTGAVEVIEIGTRRKLGTIVVGNTIGLPACLGPGPLYHMVRPTGTFEDWRGYSLTRLYRPGREILITGELPANIDAACFDAQGRFLALGNRDGTVALWDLNELQERLRKAGLGWPE